MIENQRLARPMGQTMAECDCSRGSECLAANRCLAETGEKDATKVSADQPSGEATEAWRQEIKAIIADADVGPPTDAGICVECGRWTPWQHREAHDHRDWCSAPRRYAARRDWKGRLQALIAPQSKGPEDCSPGPGGAITHPTPNQPKT